MADPTLRSTYRALWEASDVALRAGTYKPDPIPAQGDSSWGLSLVFRVEGHVLASLSAELDEMVRIRRAPHLVYASRDLHSTVRSLEGFQGAVPPNQVAHYARQLKRVSNGLGAIEIDYIGLGGGTTGIFACGYPSPSLAELRRRLHDDQLLLGPLGVAGADANRVRNTAHVSLLLFRSPKVIETDLAEYVSARTDQYYGTATITSLSLVRYEPKCDSVNMEELARIEIGDGASVTEHGGEDAG
jgi:hypothetical protein